MYRCRICLSIRDGHLIKHILYRKNGQIEYEVNICTECQIEIEKVGYYNTLKARRVKNTSVLTVPKLTPQLGVKKTGDRVGKKDSPTVEIEKRMIYSRNSRVRRE